MRHHPRNRIAPKVFSQMIFGSPLPYKDKYWVQWWLSSPREWRQFHLLLHRFPFLCRAAGEWTIRGRGGGLSHYEDCKCVSSGPPVRRNLWVIPLCVSSNSSRQDFLSFRQNPILSPILPVVEHERPFLEGLPPFETEKKPNMLGRVLALSLVFLCLRVQRAYNSRWTQFGAWQPFLLWQLFTQFIRLKPNLCWCVLLWSTKWPSMLPKWQSRKKNIILSRWLW